MNAEILISRYNHMNGQPVLVSTLKEFHADIQKFLDSKGTGPYVPELKNIYDRLAKGIKAAGNEKLIRIVNSPIEKLSAGEKNSRAGIGLKDLMNLKGLIAGLECITDDSGLDSKPLDGLSDTTYKVITDKILELIKKDGLIWRKPWNEKVNGPTDMAHNHVTKHIYRGGNFYLNYLSFSSPKFFTFNQIKKLGGKLDEGSKGLPVIYFKWIYKNMATGKLVDEKEALQNGRLRKGYEQFPALFYYVVFNYEQTTGIKIKAPIVKAKTQKEKIESAEEILEGMPKRPKTVSGGQAWYQPGSDTVQLVPLNQFKKEQEYYSVAFHEYIHSTAHATRVGRELKGRFGDKSYAFEELIAELGASYLCGESGILYFTLNNSAAYIQGWSKKLRSEMEADPKFFLRAASAAQKASDFMLARGEFHDLKKIKTPVHQKAMAGVKVKKAKRKKIVKETKKQKAKVAKVIHEFKAKKLKTPQGKVVKKKDQAVAIALREAKVPKKMKVSGVLSGDDISKMTFSKIAITGKYANDFGQLYNDTQIMIWGPPGGGKTVYVLELAQYMASELNLKVLFIANEELGRSSFTEKINEFKIGDKNLSFTKNLKGQTVSNYDVVFFDSVQSIGMDLEAYKTFVEENPGRIYVLIIQSTKEGDFRGGKDWEHEVDIAGEVINRKLVLRKNRLDKDFSKKSFDLIKEAKVKEGKFKKQVNSEINAEVKKEIENPKAA